MPTWLIAALPYIAEAPTIAASVVRLAKVIADELRSSDDPLTKAEKVTEDIAQNAPAIEHAVMQNTPHAAAGAGA